MSNALLDLSVILPLLSGFNATAAKVTAAVPGLGFWNPSANTV